MKVIQINRHGSADELTIQNVDRPQPKENQVHVRILDAVLDLVGGYGLERSYPCVKKGGLLITSAGTVNSDKGQKLDIETAPAPVPT